MVKRTPKSSPKTRKLRRTSPAKSTAAVVVASVNKCHRRLIKIFKKLVRIATPRKRGYRIIEKSPPEIPIRRSLFQDFILPPPIFPDKKTVFLDLDETLVHSTVKIPPEKYDFVVRPVLDGVKVDFFVLKRSFVDEFLSFLSRKYEIVAFTAGIEEYASLVIDKLDFRGVISHRLYRNSCKEIDGKFVKDLSETGRDLKNIIIVDDNPFSYQFQPENAIQIKPFTDNLEDDELKKLIPLFQGFEEANDVRESIKLLTRK